MTWDVIVIGSGFGGAMVASPLVAAGYRVLMLERGGWVSRGPASWGPHGAGLVTPYYTKDSPYDVRAGRHRYSAGSWHCVGGQSVFYGGASYRFRESDFADRDGATWPFTYETMEPWYGEAERLLQVAGATGADPTEPRRSTAYPQSAAALSESAACIADAAARLGLHPSRIPLAISYRSNGAQRGCVACGTCDGYACAAEAKNDVASAVIPNLIRNGMTLRTNTVCVRLVRRGSRVVGVECIHRVTGEREHFEGTRVVLAGGTLATPHILLASNLARVNPAAHAVGRYLTRHRNAVVFGAFARRPNAAGVFDKQVAILDFYDDGCIQQMTPPVGLAQAYLPRVMKTPVRMVLRHASGLLVIAEDEPRLENGVTVDWSRLDRYSLPRLQVHHAYSARDEGSAGRLVAHAKAILREAGARFTFVHGIETFSHALGTVRMGRDPQTAPLDEYGRYRGLDNLYVSDGSGLPRSAGVNPSLTIAANALRIGAAMAADAHPARPRRGRRNLPTISVT